MSFFVERDLSGIGPGLMNASSALSTAIQNIGQQRALQKKDLQQQQKNLQQGTILSNALQSLGEDPSPISYMNFINKSLEAGVEPEKLKLFAEAFAPQMKEQAKRSSSRRFLEEIGIFGPKGEEIEGEFKQELTTPTPKSPDSSLSGLSEQQLIAMGSSPFPQAQEMAKIELQLREGRKKDFRSDRDYAYKRAGKFLDSIDTQRKTAADQSEALRLMEDAVNSGNTEFFSKDNFANFLGRFGEGLRTAKGAQLLNAQKEFLVSDIGRVGSRPNQWIEQQISSALTKIGRSKEANLTIVEALKARNERDKKRIELADEIEEKYTNELGYPPPNMSRLVDQAMKPYEKEISDRLAYRTRFFHEGEMSKPQLERLSNKKVPFGTPLTAEMARVFLEKYGTKEKAKKMAKKMGYRIPSLEEYRSYIQ